ncbi:MAG: RHS repeat-associated core domain-containing protein [Actinomycetota bacterium]|nr:RHS repeat-associated core domain-containing protein [Actinomycetota bacterium]
MVATYAYDAYGNLTTESGSATTPLLFQGQYFDQALGADDLRARWYDPGSTPFLSVDPLAATTETPFGDAGGDPVNGSDPTGLAGGPGEAGGTGRLAGLGMCPAEIAAVQASAGPVLSDIGSFVVARHTAIEVGFGVVLGVAAALTGVGAVVEGVAALGAEGEAADALLVASRGLGLASLLAGGGATTLAAGSCIYGHSPAACVGFALGGLSLVGSGLGEIGAVGAVSGQIAADSLPSGALFAAGLFGTTLGIAGTIYDTVAGVGELSRRGACGAS